MTDSAKIPNTEVEAFKSKALPNYNGEILLKITSKMENICTFSPQMEVPHMKNWQIRQTI